MKALIALGFFSLTLNTLAHAGPRSDGGGNLLVRINSVEKVNTALDQAKQEAITNFGLLVMDNGLGKPWGDPVLDKVMRVLTKGADPMPMGSYIEGSAFQKAINAATIVRKQGACPSQAGHPKDSSVSEFKPGSPICISVTSLQRVDDEFLQAQISALLAHEVSHQFGFDEEAAVRVQKAVFQSSQHSPWLFDYVGINVRVMNEPTKKPAVSNAAITIKGIDAQALYETMEVNPQQDSGDEDHPAMLLKQGKSYFCAKYLPIDENSDFAKKLRRWNKKNVRTYDFVCQIHVRRESGKIIRY